MIFDNRLRELIATGASIGANCQSCLEYHTAKAKENGASELEIREAINTGKTVRIGAANFYDSYIASATGEASCSPNNACSPEGSCGCGCK